MQTHLKLDEVIDALPLLVIESEPETVVELLGTPVTDAEADEVMLVPGREIEGREMGRDRDRELRGETRKGGLRRDGGDIDVAASKAIGRVGAGEERELTGRKGGGEDRGQWQLVAGGA